MYINDAFGVMIRISAAVVGCFAIVPTGILRSFASKTVEPQEVGKLYSIAADGGKLIRQNFIYISGNCFIT